MKPAKPRLKKGQYLFHKSTKEKVMFCKWKDENQVILLNSKKAFITILIEDFIENFTSYSELEKQAKERRKFQGW